MGRLSKFIETEASETSKSSKQKRAEPTQSSLSASSDIEEEEVVSGSDDDAEQFDESEADEDVAASGHASSSEEEGDMSDEETSAGAAPLQLKRSRSTRSDSGGSVTKRSKVDQAQAASASEEDDEDTVGSVSVTDPQLMSYMNHNEESTEGLLISIQFDKPKNVKRVFDILAKLENVFIGYDIGKKRVVFSGYGQDMTIGFRHEGKMHMIRDASAPEWGVHRIDGAVIHNLLKAVKDTDTMYIKMFDNDDDIWISDEPNSEDAGNYCIDMRAPRQTMLDSDKVFANRECLGFNLSMMNYMYTIKSLGNKTLENIVDCANHIRSKKLALELKERRDGNQSSSTLMCIRAHSEKGAGSAFDFRFAMDTQRTLQDSTAASTHQLAPNSRYTSARLREMDSTFESKLALEINTTLLKAFLNMSLDNNLVIQLGDAIPIAIVREYDEGSSSVLYCTPVQPDTDLE